MRPQNEQSPGIISHERRRAYRLAAVFDDLAAQDVLSGPMNLVQLLVFCALNVRKRVPDFDWDRTCPQLAVWFERMLELPSVRDSEPPSGS